MTCMFHGLALLAACRIHDRAHAVSVTACMAALRMRQTGGNMNTNGDTPTRNASTGPANAAPPDPAGAGHQRTVLLVDDEENMISSLKRLLRREGYRILSAGGGVEGLEILAKHRVDVIVSDQR